MKNSLLILFAICFVALSCKDSSVNGQNYTETNNLQLKRDSMKNQISTFLTFQDGNAESAMNFYVKLFDNSEILSVNRWGKDGPVEEGKVMHGKFTLNGNSFMCSDSPPIHDWDFTPAVSNFIECKSEAEQERLFNKLSENGTVTMPLNNYGFSKKFGWVVDQYGISWQLNLP